jgi:hypothetical protein
MRLVFPASDPPNPRGGDDDGTIAPVAARRRGAPCRGTTPEEVTVIEVPQLATAVRAEQPGPVGASRRRGLAAAAGAVAVSAWAGAAGLALDALGLPDRLVARLPLASPVLGGLALAVVVAVPFSVVTVLAWRADPRADAAAHAAGLVLVGWIVVELLFVRELSFLHPLMAAIGLAFTGVGRRRRR